MLWVAINRLPTKCVGICITLMTTSEVSGAELLPNPDYGIEYLLRKFDQISARGFVLTRRFGHNGAGYKPEALPGLVENHGPMKLQRAGGANTLLLLDEADAIGYWRYAVLTHRLSEKHSQVVFAGRGRARSP
ncbi:MAG: hypothetical protein MK110_01130 [Fuerstiella sp.]|nr:hypothetical protein [Fuerstiella sp.]